MATARQLARRARILDAAALLAVEGGLAAVNVREVAEHAGVALSTLYRHHPTKTHLVLAVMERELERARDRLEHEPPPGGTATARVTHVLEEIARSWDGVPAAAEAMLQAFLTAGDDEDDLRRRVSAILHEILVLAMWGPEQDARPADRAVARLLQTQLVGSLAEWAGRRASPAELRDDLRLATAAIMRLRDQTV